jgi:hypothetical protein
VLAGTNTKQGSTKPTSSKVHPAITFKVIHNFNKFEHPLGSPIASNSNKRFLIEFLLLKSKGQAQPDKRCEFVSS